MSRSLGPALLGLLLVCTLSGCDRSRAPGGEPFRVDRRDHASEPAHERAVLAQIGSELRPVPFAREPALVSTIRVRTHAGWVRTNATLADVDLRHGYLSLSWAFSGSDQFMGIKEPWRVRAHPRRPTRGKIALRSPLGAVETEVDLRLERIPPPPLRLDSEPFHMSPGATLEIGYGVVPSRRRSGGKTTFAATLDCDWAWPVTVVRDTIGPDAQWHDASLRRARGGSGCRLHLESEPGGDGEPLWSVPRVTVPTTSERTNVVLVSLDTLRADHLSAYGYPRRTSPAIDERLVARGATFMDTSTTYPVTNVAHLGLFTSRYPAGLPADGALGRTAPIRMLTEVLRDAGFSTAGITEDGLVSHAYGFGWGFDRLVEHLHAPVEGAQRVFDEGRSMLQTLRDRRFFLFLHTYKVHDPYHPAPAFRDAFPPSPADDVVHRRVPEAHRATFDDYDRCIREVDHHVGELLQTLDELGLADRTLVVLTSDHGEAFGEHVVIGHGFSCHQEAVHVPLVFRGPGVLGGRRIATPVSLVDVMPTILDLLGLPAPADIQGRSLRDALAGREVAGRPVFFQWFGADHVGMRSGPAKLLRVGSTFQTFDLSKDPDEEAGTPGAPTLGVTDIQQYLDDGTRRRQALVDTPRALTISPELHDALRGLGYVE